MPFFYMDYWYLVLVVPALLVTLWAQIKVQSTFKKYSQIGTRQGLTGDEASRIIQRQGGITVPIERVQGSLTDHYDPQSNVIWLSEPVYGVNSISAIGVAAHETGHALQYEQGYGPIRLRAAIVPVTRFGSVLAPYLVVAGLIFSIPVLAYAGIAFFSLAVLFQLVTLPVEFNASSRAIRALEEGGLMTSEELAGAKKVLWAAAMTYVASLFLALMSLLRMVILVLGRGRNHR